MSRVWGSVAFRLALGYVALTLVSMAIVAAIFYFGTVGVVASSGDGKLWSMSQRLVSHYDMRGSEVVADEIGQLLADGVDQDTEIYQLIGPDGRKVAGNLSGWTPAPGDFDQLRDRGVIRNGQASVSRLLARTLPDGGILVVGRDLHDQLTIERIVWRALMLGALGAAALAVLGALLFHRRVERRIAAIRRIAHDIGAGDLTRRIPVYGDDEFARLGHDINRMLDQIEHLIQGVRHVSNAIAHDLRTPLGRIRGQLDNALRPGQVPGQLDRTARLAIASIDELIQVFDRLLQIAEAESGARRQSFEPVRLGLVIADVVEMYDAVAESRGISLHSEIGQHAVTLGDRNLLASAIANLLDNALKYCGPGAMVRVSASAGRDGVSVTVEDNGPGIPPSQRQRVTERFYRLDGSRHLPGNGLGLSIVSSIATLHWGELRLDDADPGLRATLVLPHPDPALVRPGGEPASAANPEHDQTVMSGTAAGNSVAGRVAMQLIGDTRGNGGPTSAATATDDPGIGRVAGGRGLLAGLSDRGKVG